MAEGRRSSLPPRCGTRLVNSLYMGLFFRIRKNEAYILTYSTDPKGSDICRGLAWPPAGENDPLSMPRPLDMGCFARFLALRVATSFEPRHFA